MLNLHLIECTLKGYDHISDLLLAKYWVITGCKYLGCSSLKEVIIPDKVASIEQEAFSGSSFNKIIIGKNVTKIGIYSLCTTCNTAEYYCYAVTPPTLEQKYTESPFTKESKATAKLYVPTGCAAVYRSSHWKQYFNNIIEMD